MTLSQEKKWAHFSRISFELMKEDIVDLSNFILIKLRDTKFLEAFSCLEHKLLEDYQQLNSKVSNQVGKEVNKELNSPQEKLEKP